MIIVQQLIVLIVEQLYQADVYNGPLPFYRVFHFFFNITVVLISSLKLKINLI